MSSVPFLPILIVALLAAWALGLGAGILKLAGGGTKPHWVPSFLMGCVALHLLLTGMQAVGVPWTRWSLVAVLGVLALGMVVGARRFQASTPSTDAPSPPLGLGWGDALAGLAWAGFTMAAVTLRSVNPDFVFHWGLKAKKFVLAGGVDFSYLAHPWNHYTHPDYPTLLPELYAASSLLSGRFSEPALLLWSAAFFAALLWSARGWLAERSSSRGIRQSGIALLGIAAAAFSIGYLQAGGADLMIALAVIAGAAALGRETSEPRTDLELGTAAAFAAASKIEGVVLAALLVGLGLLRGALRRELSTAGVVRRLLPPLLVILPWAVLSRRHGLFLDTNVGAFDGSRVGAILDALGDTLALPAWHGLPYLILLLPLLLVFRHSRWLAAVALLQLGFYLYVYTTTPVDPVFYVRSSFPRLLLHVVPAALLGGAVVVGSLWPEPTER